MKIDLLDNVLRVHLNHPSTKKRSLWKYCCFEHEKFNFYNNVQIEKILVFVMKNFSCLSIHLFFSLTVSLICAISSIKKLSCRQKGISFTNWTSSSILLVISVNGFVGVVVSAFQIVFFFLPFLISLWFNCKVFDKMGALGSL